jgi:hypothetical protein
MNSDQHLLSLFFSSFLESNKEISVNQARAKWLSPSTQDDLCNLLGESKTPIARAPTAYVIFSKEMRVHVKTEHGNKIGWTHKMTTGEVRKRWDKLGSKELKIYTDKEHQARAEYEKQNGCVGQRESSNTPIKQIYNSQEKRGRRSTRPTGYRIFSNSIRDSVREANPGIDSVSLSGKILQTWVGMTNKTQEEWIRKAIQ